MNTTRTNAASGVEFCVPRLPWPIVVSAGDQLTLDDVIGIVDAVCDSQFTEERFTQTMQVLWNEHRKYVMEAGKTQLTPLEFRQAVEVIYGQVQRQWEASQKLQRRSLQSGSSNSPSGVSDSDVSPFDAMPDFTGDFPGVTPEMVKICEEIKSRGGDSVVSGKKKVRGSNAKLRWLLLVVGGVVLLGTISYLAVL